MATRLTVRTVKLNRPCDLKRIERHSPEVQVRGPDPAHFVGLRVLLDGDDNRRITLTGDGESTVPAESRITGVELPAGSGIAEVVYDDHPDARFMFAMTPSKQLLRFHIDPTEPPTLDEGLTSIDVRGIGHLTRLIPEALKYGAAETAGETVPIDGRSMSVSAEPAFRAVMKLYCPRLDIVRVKTEYTASDEHETPKGSATVTIPRGFTSGPVLELPEGTRGLKVTLPGYPPDTLVFFTVDGEPFVCAREKAHGTESGRYSIMHLRLIGEARQALKQCVN